MERFRQCQKKADCIFKIHFVWAFKSAEKRHNYSLSWHQNKKPLFTKYLSINERKIKANVNIAQIFGARIKYKALIARFSIQKLRDARDVGSSNGLNYGTVS